MDINQSSYSKYKSDQSEMSRHLSDTRSSSDASRLKGAFVSNLQSIKQLDLKEGQIVKGQIIDHRYNEVRIQLEPGRQVVTAKLADNIPLSIGQNARFQVTEGGSDHLVLKYLPNKNEAPADATVMKALSSSNLAATDLNKSIVSELLNNRMPIDKQTLQSLIKLSYTNQGVSPLTLVLMLKNNIPMTKENISQFEAYQNGTNKLINDISVVTKNISGLLQNPETGFSPALADQSEILGNSPIIPNPSGQNTDLQSKTAKDFQLPTAAFSKEALNQAIQTNSKLIDILYSNTGNSPREISENTLSNPLSPEELQSFSRTILQNLSEDTFLSSSLPTDLMNRLQNNTLSSADTQALLHFLSAQENNTDSSLISKLIKQLAPASVNTVVLSQVLNQQEQTALLNNLEGFRGFSDSKNQLQDGTATLQKILTFLQESLPETSGEAAGKLLLSPEYSKLLESAFLKKWTLTPEKMSKQSVTELYQNLQEDVDKLSHLAKAERDASQSLQLNEPLKNIKENLSFLKDLNEVYTYLPLPVQLKDQNLHSDLYVLTRKKSLQDNSGQLSVLLHLDMNYLGPLNVHLQMNNSNIQAKFYLENKDAEQLLEQNIPLLEEALTKKGYHLHASFESNYSEPDFSKDFIVESTTDHLVKRYTFDIRT